MSPRARRGRRRAFGAGFAALVTLAGVLFGIGVVSGSSRADAGTTGSSPEVYVSAGTVENELAADNPSGGFDPVINGTNEQVGATAINATSTLAVATVAFTNRTLFIPPVVDVLHVPSNSSAGSIRVTNAAGGAVAPIGFAMDPANPNIAFGLISGGTDEGGSVVELNLATLTSTTLVTLPTDPEQEQVTATAIGITPDGSAVIVGWWEADDYDGLFSFSTSSGARTGEWFQTTARLQLSDLAIAPSGTTVYGLETSRTALSRPFAVNYPLPKGNTAPTWEPTLKTPSDGRAITVSPDGQTVYVVGGFSGESFLQALTSSGQQSGQATIPISSQGATDGAASVAETPSGNSLFVGGVDDASGNSLVYPIATSGLVVGGQINMGATGGPAGPQDIAITPDQAPVADLFPASGTAGSAVTLDASGSTVAYGSIASYAWNFGDGTTTTTSTPTVSHLFASAGNYTVIVTETDAAGNGLPPAPGVSSSVNTPGQTPYFDASPSAQITAPVAISKQGTPPPPPPTTTVHHTTTTLHHTTTTTVPKKSQGPHLILNPAVGPPGTIVTVTGSGFPDNTPITISWSTLTGSEVVTSNGNGVLPPSQLMILVPDVLGQRYAVPSVDPTAKVPFLVVPGTSEPGGDQSTFLFRSEGP